MATTTRGRAIRERDIQLRDSLYPGAAERLWDRQRFHGFATIPKTMPYICRILDEMSKGAPLASTYLALWCATWDNAFVKLTRLPDLAFSAGFSGQRGSRTFQDRLKRLADLGFAEIQPSGSHVFGLVFLPNPHIVIMRHHEAKLRGTDAAAKLKASGMQEATFNAFLERAQEIDATDVKAELKRLSKEAKTAKKASVAGVDAKTERRKTPNKGIKLRRPPGGTIK